MTQSNPLSSLQAVYDKLRAMPPVVVEVWVVDRPELEYRIRDLFTLPSSDPYEIGAIRVIPWWSRAASAAEVERGPWVKRHRGVWLRWSNGQWSCITFHGRKVMQVDVTRLATEQNGELYRLFAALALIAMMDRLGFHGSIGWAVEVCRSLGAPYPAWANVLGFRGR
jgi:hypothetical protein